MHYWYRILCRDLNINKLCPFPAGFRLIAWLGIACHSVCCRYEKEKEVQKLERAPPIFSLAQLDNPEVQRLQKVVEVLLTNRE